MRIEEESIAPTGGQAVENTAGRERGGLDPGFQRNGILDCQGVLADIARLAVAGEEQTEFRQRGNGGCGCRPLGNLTLGECPAINADVLDPAGEAIAAAGIVTDP